MLLATDAFQRYSDAVGGTLDDQTGLLKIKDTSLVGRSSCCRSLTNWNLQLQSLYYKIGDTILSSRPKVNNGRRL